MYYVRYSIGRYLPSAAPLDDCDEEDLLHAAVEAGDALKVERLGGLVDHGAVRDGVGGN